MGDTQSLTRLLTPCQQDALLQINCLVKLLQPDGRYWVEQACVVPKRLLRLWLAGSDNYMADHTPKQDEFFAAVPGLERLGLVDKDASFHGGSLPQPREIDLRNHATVRLHRGYVVGGNEQRIPHMSSEDLAKAEPLTDPDGWRFVVLEPGLEVRISVFSPDGRCVDASSREYWVGWRLTAEGARLAEALDRMRKAGAADSTGAGAAEAIFRQENPGLWYISYKSQEARVKHAEGLRIIHQLLQRPNPRSPIPAMELLGRPSVVAERYGTDSQFDDTALKQYRERLEDLEDLISQAEASGAECEHERWCQERDQILALSQQGTGRKGKTRQLGSSGSAASARSAVRKNLTRAEDLLRKVGLTELADHVHMTIMTCGDSYQYCPVEPAPAWRLD